MTLRTIISFLTLLFLINVQGQTRTLVGKVINDEFYPIYLVSIFSADSVLLTKSDTSGNFSITIPLDTKTLLVADVGMEWKSLELLSDCNNLDIVLQPSATYDFMSPAKVDRLRKKQFDKLPALYKSAFEKGIFKKDKPCYVDKFIPHKKAMLESHRARKRMPST